MIFFFIENENMHVHMITGHLNVLKLSMNSCSFFFGHEFNFYSDKFLNKNLFRQCGKV